MKKVNRRISRAMGFAMLGFAIFIDLAQAAAKLLMFTGLAVVGTGLGAYLGDFLGIAETGAAIGGILGGLAQFTGIGTAASAAVGLLMSMVFSLTLTFIGYLTLGLWFLMYGVSPMSGKYAHKKLLAGLCSAIFEFLPLFNVIPGLTYWTHRTLAITKKEDEEAAKERAQNEARNYRRVRRQYVTDGGQTQTVANDDEQQNERAA